eukprot:gene9095-9265_t
MGEMAFARKLIKGDRVERARLYKAVNERCFGAQIATNNIAEGVAAAQLAQEAGAAWMDLNCGCPIHEATKRGLGAALLRKPTKLAKLVAGITSQVSLPVTVKIRTDALLSFRTVFAIKAKYWKASAAVTSPVCDLKYKKAADWQLLAELARSNSVPVVGNGDILTFYEAADRQQLTDCAALMVGRGALIKPWLFQELKEGRELLLSSEDRIGVYRQLAAHMKQHFGDDAMGRRKAFFFLPWHFSFFCRYRHLPAEVYHEQSKLHPLIATRADLADSRVGEKEDTLSLLERLLRCENEAAHGPIADIIWDSTSDGEAVSLLSKVAEAQLPEWEQQLRASSREDTADVDMIAEG